MGKKRKQKVENMELEKIELHTTNKNDRREFEKAHAEAILLSMLKKSKPTWFLSNESKYIFTNGNLILKSSIGDTKDSKE
jgi:hypothetical protein